MSCTIDRLTWPEFWHGFRSLMEQHHREVRGHVPLDPDYDLLTRMDAAGVLLILGASLDDRPAGYVSWFIGPNVQLANTLIAQQGPWFVVPELRKRGLGLDLLRASFEALRARNVTMATTTRHLTLDDQAARLFESLGAAVVEADLMHTLWIGTRDV